MKAIERFHEERMKKEFGSSSIVNGGETSGESSVGSSTTRKESVTKMKDVRKKHAQKHDYDLEVDAYWISYKNRREWIEE